MPTITYLHLVGTYEHLDKTISNQLSTNWTSANTGGKTPVFKSATGTNVTHSWPYATGMGDAQVHCNEDENHIFEANNSANGDMFDSFIAIVYIDVFAPDANFLKLFMKEITDIVWKINPNSATRVNKVDGTASHANTFVPPHVQWKVIRSPDPNVQLMPHASGQLKVRYYKSKA